MLFEVERPSLWAGVCALVWAVLLFTACIMEGAWWPIFNVFFLILGLLPYIFGSHNSSGLWGAVGDFISGGVIVSLFAFPVVLHNAYQIGPQTLTTVAISNVFLIASVWMGVSMVSL